MADLRGHEQQAADKGDHAETGHGQEGLAPAKMLADECPKRHAGHQCHGQAGKHDGDGARGALLWHQAGGDGRADREEHAMREAGKNARHDQRFIARRLPRQQVAGGEQRHQGEQQQLAGQAAGEGGQHWRADSHAQCVQAHQQAGGRHRDVQVRRDGRNQADDHEFRRPDGKGADR
ncbi:hypothetical protein D3C72_1076720 [compost metagenome]